MSDEIVTLEDDDQVLDVELENYNVPVQEAVIHEGATAYWNAQSSLIAESGHIYAYTDYTTVEGNDSPGIKVGDGVTLLSELPFVSGDMTVLDAHIANTVIHVTAAEKESWDSKVDPEEGKGLSENDFTDALKEKLEGIEAGAEVNVQSDWAETDTTADSFIQHKPEIPENTSDLINDSGFITANEAPVQGVKGSAESSYRTGNVSVSKADIGLGNVDNTSDLNKPISTAVQTALDGKQGTLTAGENITIDANNVISASGGGTGDVESVNGKTGVVVLDADDVGALPDSTTAADLGAYVKPTGGIPKSDLASAVRTSLDKADTALQTAPVTSVNSKTGAVVLNASDVGAYVKPSGGIPKSDLASSIQTSLDKADTALQTAPVTSVNGKTGSVSLNASDVGALPDSTAIPTKTSDLTNDSGFITASQAPVTSVDGKTGAVTVMPSGGTAGQVLTKTASGADWETIDATDIETSSGVAIKSVNGNPVTIADALQGKALGVNASIEPIQDLHGYDHPWAGGAGKNLLPMTVDGIKAANDSPVGQWNGNIYTYSGCTYEILTDDANNVIGIKVNGTSTAIAIFWIGVYNYIANTAMRINAGVSTGSNSIFFRVSGDGKESYTHNIRSIGTDETVNISSNAELWGNIRVGNGVTLSNMVFKPSLVMATETTDFAPYSNICPITGRTQVEISNKDSEDVEQASVTVDLGQTVYGGTLNVTTGELVVDKAMVDLGTLNWMLYSEIVSRFNAPITPFVKPTGNYNTAPTMLCSEYNVLAQNSVYANNVGISAQAMNGQALYVYDPAYTDAASFKTAMSGVQLVYELATTQTIKLTPAQINLLTGTNIISTNADDLSVRYYATGQTGNVEGNIAFLSEKTVSNETAVNTVSESIAPAETGTTTQNYATGSYLMLNNRLCKVTAAIATGESIIVGSNVQYTTIADELLAIFSQLNA